MLRNCSHGVSVTWCKFMLNDLNVFVPQHFSTWLVQRAQAAWSLRQFWLHEESKRNRLNSLNSHQTRVSVTLGVHVKGSLSMLPSSRTDFWPIQLTMSSFYYITFSTLSDLRGIISSRQCSPQLLGFVCFTTDFLTYRTWYCQPYSSQSLLQQAFSVKQKMYKQHTTFKWVQYMHADFGEDQYLDVQVFLEGPETVVVTKWYLLRTNPSACSRALPPCTSDQDYAPHPLSMTDLAVCYYQPQARRRARLFAVGPLTIASTWKQPTCGSSKHNRGNTCWRTCRQPCNGLTELQLCSCRL